VDGLLSSCFTEKYPEDSYTNPSLTFQLDFYIDDDMIHIADTKVSHRYGDFFVRKILKFNDLNRKLKNINI